MSKQSSSFPPSRLNRAHGFAPEEQCLRAELGPARRLLSPYQGTQSDSSVRAVSIGFGLKRRHVAVTFIPVPTFS